MIEFKIISDTEDEIEFEITQPNDLLGDTKEWTEEDWEKWNKKMEEVEAQGIKGQLETIKIKLQKNPFINGNGFLTPTSGQESETGKQRELGFGIIDYRDETSGSEV